MKSFELKLDKEKVYLLALSGGADSVCLFHLLRLGGFTFSAAHVNHGIRGKEADRDEEFCRRLADEYGIKLHLLRADVPAMAKDSGKSLEEAARLVRYSFFEKLMREHDIPVLLTAHNADDNAETLLLSLARGCSPSGACGIKPTRALGFGEVKRPLLSLSKKDILRFCHESSYGFVTDSTNADVSYPRNRIRANVLPQLSAINHEFLAAIARFTELQELDCLYLEAEAEKYADMLECKTIASLPYPIASRAISLAAYRAGARPEALHIQGLLQIAEKQRGSLSLPGSILASCEKGRIIFRPDRRKKETSPYPEYEKIMLCEGENMLPQGKLILVSGELTNDSVQIYNLSISAIINLDRIKGQFYARPRREGDRILLGGMHKSVKKLISEKLSHLPLEERRALPVICHGEEVVWIPGLPVADPYRGGISPTIYYCAE